MRVRRTKIAATIGPASDAPDVLDRLLEAGLDCARLNCSHGTHDDLRRRAAEVRAASERGGRPIGPLLALPGPQLRAGADTADRMVHHGDELTFTVPGAPGGGAGRVAVDFPTFSALVT